MVELELLQDVQGVLLGGATCGDEQLERLPGHGALLPSDGHSPSRAAALKPVRVRQILPKSVGVSVAIMHTIERSEELVSTLDIAEKAIQNCISLNLLLRGGSVF